MKRYFFLLSLWLLCGTTYAQGGLWAHMGGSLGSGALGLYGTKGVPDPTNQPAGRYQCAFWTDKQGNFWIFGGFHPFGYSNDLWKFDITTGIWTWMNGPMHVMDQNGEWGTQGVPSPNNYPSARTFGPNCWTDNNGDLWLYGGFGFDAFNAQGGLADLWKYSIATNEWTWVSGPNTVGQLPVYGTRGVAAPANTPGARSEIKSGWVDDNNHLWMFGGQDGATATTAVNVRSDMWRYDISTNQWTWMKGSNLLNPGGTFGTKGIEDSANNPVGRLSYTKWKGKDNNFYLFAGGNSSNARNDVWRYNPFTNNWTWLSGSNVANHMGTYMGTCDPHETRFPRSRIENQTIANTGCTEIFWSFGGLVNITSQESFNDLWLYNLTTNKWTWISGSQATNKVSVPGPIGVGAPGNVIGSRGGVAIWTDSVKNIWVFGGIAFDSTINGFGLYNDLWRFQPDSSCFDGSFTPILTLDGPQKLTICPGDTVMMPVLANIQYNIEPAGSAQYSADSSHFIFSPISTTTYTIIGYETGLCSGRDTIVFTIDVVPYPVADFSISPLSSLISSPDIVLTNNSQGASSYTWYYQNMQWLSNSSDYTHTVTDTGEHCYTLVAFNTLGCSDTVRKCASKLPLDEFFVPNAFSPNGDALNATFRIRGANIRLIKFIIYNRWGEMVFRTQDLNEGWNGKHKGQDAEVGVYYYYIEYEAYGQKKIVKGDVNLIR